MMFEFAWLSAFSHVTSGLISWMFDGRLALHFHWTSPSVERVHIIWIRKFQNSKIPFFCFTYVQFQNCGKSLDQARTDRKGFESACLPDKSIRWSGEHLRSFCLLRRSVLWFLSVTGFSPSICMTMNRNPGQSHHRNRHSFFAHMRCPVRRVPEMKAA